VSPGVRHPVIYGFFALLALILLLRSIATLNKEARRRPEESLWQATRRTAKGISSDIGRVGGILMIASGGLIAAGFARQEQLGSRLVVAGSAALAVLWLLNYMWGKAGFPKPGGGRPSDPLTVLILFLIPTGCLIWESYRHRFPGFSSDAGVIGWLTIPVVATILIAARGHERRLGGAYATQRHWLEMNRPRVVRLRRTGHWEPEGRPTRR
jgi:hypothetical protein